MKDNIHQFNLRLMAVHRHLLEKARIEKQTDLGRPLPNFEFFNLLLKDEALSWLRPLSGFLAEADALTDKNYELGEHDVAKLKVRFSALLLTSLSHGHGALSVRYHAALAQDSELARLHADMLSAFQRL